MTKTRPTRTSRPASGGFSLLEVMLAVSLSAVVLAAVNTAIDIHLRVTSTNRGNVEEAQLARALFDRIAQDLRGAVFYELPDPEQIAVALPPESATGEETDGTEETGEEEALATSEGEEEVDPAGAVTSIPGLIGTISDLQVDTCRLPRADELANALISEDGVATQLSDVKTVNYFCVGYGGTSMDLGPTGELAGRGLVRREYDRAAASWLATNGAVSALNQNILPIAEEVYSVEFHYFDETGVYDSWDSNEMGGLPRVVEVTLQILPKKVNDRIAREAAQSALNQPTVNSDDRMLVYRMSVRLPAARPPAEETTATEDVIDEEATDDASAEE